MKHRIITCILAFILTVGLLPCPSADAVNDFPFKDVASNAWYYTAVDSAYQTGIIAGTSATEFAPDHNITLAQAVTFAARMHQYTQTGAVTLQNDPDVWYRSYVEYCREYGMIDPKEYEGRWNSYATRAEMVKIFHACLPEDSFAPINTIENNAIPDVRGSDHAASAKCFSPSMATEYLPAQLQSDRRRSVEISIANAFFILRAPFKAAI